MDEYHSNAIGRTWPFRSAVLRDMCGEFSLRSSGPVLSGSDARSRKGCGQWPLVDVVIKLSVPTDLLPWAFCSVNLSTCSRRESWGSITRPFPRN